MSCVPMTARCDRKAHTRYNNRTRVLHGRYPPRPGATAPEASGVIPVENERENCKRRRVAVNTARQSYNQSTNQPQFNPMSVTTRPHELLDRDVMSDHTEEELEEILPTPRDNPGLDGLLTYEELMEKKGDANWEHPVTRELSEFSILTAIEDDGEHGAGWLVQHGDRDRVVRGYVHVPCEHSAEMVQSLAVHIVEIKESQLVRSLMVES